MKSEKISEKKRRKEEEKKKRRRKEEEEKKKRRKEEKKKKRRRKEEEKKKKRKEERTITSISLPKYKSSKVTSRSRVIVGPFLCPLAIYCISIVNTYFCLE